MHKKHPAGYSCENHKSSLVSAAVVILLRIVRTCHFVSGIILIISMMFSCMLYNNEYFLKILNEKAVVLVKKEKKETKNGDEELLDTGRSSINDEPEEE